MKHTLERSVDKILQIYEEIVESRAEEDRQQDILTLPHAPDRDSASRRAA
jgi:hypothetical protein